MWLRHVSLEIQTPGHHPPDLPVQYLPVPMIDILTAAARDYRREPFRQTGTLTGNQ
jgi:hypothetical protein